MYCYNNGTYAFCMAIVLYRASHAIDAQIDIMYMRQLHVMHACVVPAVPAFHLQHLLQGRALQPTPFSSPAHEP
jgi:hypothetical protein